MKTDEDGYGAEIVRTGRTLLYRWTCRKCNREQFRGDLVCEDCGEMETQVGGERFIGSSKRRGATHTHKQRQLDIQNNRCMWCGRPFGIYYEDTKRNRVKQLTVHWDHTLPYSYLADSRNENFVAACNLCNLMKSSAVFRDESDLSAFLADKWDRKLKSNSVIFLESKYQSRPLFTEEKEE